MVEDKRMLSIPQTLSALAEATSVIAGGSVSEVEEIVVHPLASVINTE